MQVSTRRSTSILQVLTNTRTVGVMGDKPHL